MSDNMKSGSDRAKEHERVPLPEIVRDFRAVLLGERTDLAKYLYADQRAWRHVTTIDPYYIPRTELELLAINTQKLRRIVPVGTVMVDLGPGEMHTVSTKTCEMIEAIRPSQYIAVDFQRSFVAAAEEVVRNQFPKLPVQGKEMDFFNYPQPVASGQNVTMFLGGCTLSQLPLISQTGAVTVGDALRGFNRMADGKGYLVATIDTTREPQAAVACYSGEYMAKFMENFVTLLHKAGVAKNLPKQGLSYVPEWNQERSCVEHNLVARDLRKAVTLKLGRENFVIQPNQKIHLADSHKWHPDEVEAAARAEKWKAVGRLTGKNGVMGIVLKSG